MKGVVTVIAAAIFLVSGVAFAAGGHDHGEHHRDHHRGQKADPQMARLHAMMPRYAQAQGAINAALATGDLKTVLLETAYILSTTDDLKKSRPHKNFAQLDEYKRIASGFEREVRATSESAGKGDHDGAKVAFAGAQKLCDACHAKFRD